MVQREFIADGHGQVGYMQDGFAKHAVQSSNSPIRVPGTYLYLTASCFRRTFFTSTVRRHTTVQRPIVIGLDPDPNHPSVAVLAASARKLNLPFPSWHAALTGDKAHHLTYPEPSSNRSPFPHRPVRRLDGHGNQPAASNKKPRAVMNDFRDSST